MRGWSGVENKMNGEKCENKDDGTAEHFPKKARAESERAKYVASKAVRRTPQSLWVFPFATSITLVVSPWSTLLWSLYSQP